MSMKKIINPYVPYVPEEVEYYCDKHPTVKCFSQLTLTSWYGSQYDLTGITVHLCDECVKDIQTLLKTSYKAKIYDIQL